MFSLPTSIPILLYNVLNIYVLDFGHQWIFFLSPDCRLQILCPQAYSLCRILLYWFGPEFLFILEMFSNVFEYVNNILFCLWLLHLQKYIDEKFDPDEKLPWVKHFLGKGFAGKHYKITLPPTQMRTPPSLQNQRKEVKSRLYISNW